MEFPKDPCSAPLKAEAQPCLQQDSKATTKSWWRKMRLVQFYHTMPSVLELTYFHALYWGNATVSLLDTLPCRC